MDVSGFFGSYPGMYVVQSFFHLAISAAIVNAAIRVWEIEDPAVSQRFRFLGILFPVFSFPLYQIVNPGRDSIDFRQGALFDSSKWMYFEPLGKIPLGLLFILVMLLTALVFFFQELIPVIRHTIESKRGKSTDLDFRDHEDIGEVLSHIPGEKPRVLVIDDDEEPVIFSTTGRDAAVYVSSCLLNRLGHEQVRAAVAHEIAHIERSRLPVLSIVFIFRILMFFNPIVLFEFRKAAQEEEKICDDMAIALTNKPHALSEALKELYYTTGNNALPRIGNPSEFRESIEEYSHVLHIESRIERIESYRETGKSGRWVEFSLAVLAILFINYFIV